MTQYDSVKEEHNHIFEGFSGFIGKRVRIKVFDNDGQRQIEGTVKRFTTCEEYREGYRPGVIIEDGEGRMHWTLPDLLAEAEILG